MGINRLEAFIAIIIILLIIASTASCYIGQMFTTSMRKSTESTQTQPFHSTLASLYTTSLYTSAHAMRSSTYLFEIGNWAIIIELTSEGKGILTVRYVGDKPLVVENPLLPLTAGLSIVLSYSDPSKDTIIRKTGIYYYNTSVELRRGNESRVSFDARGLRLIRVEGKILGKIPVRITLPLGSKALESCICTMTVTITKTVTIHKVTQTTTTGYCEFIREAEYPEPVGNDLTRVELGNETVISDGVLEIHVPLIATGSKIPLIFENKQKTPLWVLAYYVEYMIVNATEDGVHYRQVNYRIVHVVPMTTIPPLPPVCRDKQPHGTSLINYKGIYVLEPGEKATLLKLTIPTNIDELEGFREGWMYIKAKIRYTPIKEVYRIETTTDYWSVSYLSRYYRAVALYDTREMEIVFRVYVKLPGK